MEWLNYHHLLYFWTVARLGSVARATEELYLSQPTISAQIRVLEESLGEKLFTRTGRNLMLTEAGRVVFRYADEIFSLGRELRGAVKGRSPGRPVRFVVGVADVLPKLIAYRLLEPALHLAEPIRVVCREDKRNACWPNSRRQELASLLRPQSLKWRCGGNMGCRSSGGWRPCASASMPFRWNGSSNTSPWWRFPRRRVRSCLVKVRHESLG